MQNRGIQAETIRNRMQITCQNDPEQLFAVNPAHKNPELHQIRVWRNIKTQEKTLKTT
jgi:hypothetical protein